MAFWLGKNNIDENDLSKYINNRKNLLEFYKENMKFRIIITLTQKELKEYEQAVINKYGFFSAINSRKAAEFALKSWMHKI